MVVPRGKFATTSQKQFPDLGYDTSSAWYFCARSSDVISKGNQWKRREMLAVFSGYSAGRI